MKYINEKGKEISFPLGGIGSGSIGIGGNGRFLDWEIFNRPSKGSINDFSHFAVKAIVDGKPITYILNGDLNKDYCGQYTGRGGFGFGPHHGTMCGFTHFKNVEFNGEFPVATLTFQDEKFPAVVKMTAFNPLIPGDAENSSIPAGFFEIKIENTTDKAIDYQIALSVANPYEVSKNSSSLSDGVQAVTLSNQGVGKDSTEYGEITIATDCESSLVQTYWYRGRWKDSIVSFLNEFDSAEDLKDRVYNEPKIKDFQTTVDTGTVVAKIHADAGKTEKTRFVISWNVPNCYNYWSEYRDENGKDITWKNYYATIFENSLESATYSLKNWDMLYGKTLMFKNTLHNSSMPQAVIDAAASNLSVLKSSTVLRLEDGTFYGWEGLDEKIGSCEGTCQHVWNYAYALCFLFPELERSIRDAEFKYATDENGKTTFRLTLPIGREQGPFRACLDGQMGCVIKSYREWKLSGNEDWLKSHWQTIKNVLEYAWSDKNPDKWDFDKDGVLEGRQHHTLDMELFGPSSWLEGMYLAALKAAAEMAEYLGETDKAREYTEIFEKGKKWTAENLFNGRYFIQKVDLSDRNMVAQYDEAETDIKPAEEYTSSQLYWNDEVNEIKYQIGNGSSIDQLLAQWHADIIGLGEIFDSEQTDKALDEMMKLNYKDSMRDVVNAWRNFSVDDEAGSVICVYPPEVQKPKIPIPYSEETMTGFEYSFAGLLCSRNKIDDGVKVAKAVRDRFDGCKRNPYNEFECGSNYARSMASYALIPILSGFEFDMPNNHIGFNPYLKTEFQTVWSLDGAWGNFEIKDNKVTLYVLDGAITLSSFGAKFLNNATELKLDGQSMSFTFDDGIFKFEKTTIRDCLEIRI